jgi:hypothetical protein
MKFSVFATVTISISTEVEANTPQEAAEIAGERGMIGLCHQCASGDPEQEWVTSGELDGTPENVRAEEK